MQLSEGLGRLLGAQLADWPAILAELGAAGVDVEREADGWAIELAKVSGYAAAARDGACHPRALGSGVRRAGRVQRALGYNPL